MTTGKRLLLWDIDGTLIATGGAGEKSLQRMVRERFGVADDFHDIEIAGRTDAHITANILKKYGVETSADNVSEFLGDYLRGLEDTLPKIAGRILPGVAEILQRLERNSDIVLGLLTGNMRRGAELKLRHYGLWHYFAFGAFADDHTERDELGAFAIARATELHGQSFAGAQIDVIGDTGHDIACGKIISARTVAVATGTWTRAKLADCAPDFLFDDFSRVDAVMGGLGW